MVTNYKNFNSYPKIKYSTKKEIYGVPKNKNKHNGVIQYHQFIFSYQKKYKK
jgi:hypothetical protein